MTISESVWFAIMVRWLFLSQFGLLLWWDDYFWVSLVCNCGEMTISESVWFAIMVRWLFLSQFGLLLWWD